MKKLIALLLAALLVFSLVACGETNQPATPEDGATEATGLAPMKKEGPLKIGFVPIVMNTMYTMVVNGCNEQIEKYGGAEFGELLVQAPSANTSSIEAQIEILNNLLQQDIDVILLSSESDEAMIPLIDEAAAKGIPTIMFNMSGLSEGNQYVANVSFSNYEAAKQMGIWVGEHYDGPTKIGVLEGYPGVINDDKVAGFKDGISGYSNLEIVASQPANWNRAEGQSVTENMLTANPDISFIAGLYDEMSLGAIAAIKQQGLLGQVGVGGIDCTPDGRDSILAGEMSVTIDTASKEMGRLLIEACKRYLKDGESFDINYYVEAMNDCLVTYDATNIDKFDVSNYS